MNWAGLLNLLIVYVVWGSTYLAIRVAVQPGAGFPPFTLAATRVFVAGTLMVIGAILTRQQVRPTRKDLFVLLGSGALLWLGGNGMVSLAEQRVGSGLAALIIGSTPIWVALIESVLDRKAPSLFLILALLTGFCGIGLLSAPLLFSGVRGDAISVGVLLIATLCWGSGTILQRRNPVNLSATVSSAYQHLGGGVALTLAVLFMHEPRPTPTPAAWGAWGYLVVFGSILAFTAYVRTIRLLPISVVMTYAYVNPVIAVFLGWLILREPITGWTIAGSALVLLGVAGVFRARAGGGGH